MVLRGASSAFVCGLALLLVGDVGRTQEQEPGPAIRMPLARGQRQGGPQRPGSDIPEVEAEMERHRAALRGIFMQNMTLAREIGRSLHALREAGAEEAELLESAKQFAPQAEGIAERVAAENATHHANMARIFQPENEAQRKELIQKLAAETIRRMVGRVTRRPMPPAGQRPRWRPGDHGPRQWQPQGPPGGGNTPENF